MITFREGADKWERIIDTFNKINQQSEFLNSRIGGH